MPADPSDPVELASVTSEFEAATIVEALRAQGIPAQHYGGGIAGFRAEVPSFVRVMVRTKDLDKARLALRAIQAESIDIDWDEVDVGSPEEPARESRPDASGYRCARCGYPADHLRPDQSCPECGQSVLPVEPLPTVQRTLTPHARRERIKSLMLQLVVVIVGLFTTMMLRLPFILVISFAVACLCLVIWIIIAAFRDKP